MSKYVLAGEHFATKKELTERVRGILRSGIGEVSGQDFRFLYLLFQWHPSREKRTHQIRRIHVVNSRFDIERHDGTTEDISYKKALDNFTGLDIYRKSVLVAMRFEVRAQIEEFRKLQPLEYQHFQVDQPWPDTFVSIVRGFLRERGITYSDVKLLRRRGRPSAIAEPRGSAWREYHRERTTRNKFPRFRMLRGGVNSRNGDRKPVGSPGAMYELRPALTREDARDAAPLLADLDFESIDGAVVRYCVVRERWLVQLAGKRKAAA